MFKKFATSSLLIFMILTTTACGLDISATSSEPEVIIQEVVTEVEVPVVSTVTTSISEEDITIDTVSNLDSSFKSFVETTNKYAVYFSQPRYFESNGGIVWTSDDSAIAIVDEDGLVTALDEGTTTIRCIDESGKQTVSYDIFCTTKNDGKDIITYSEFSEDIIWNYYNYRSYEELQAKISTVRDVMKFICTRGYYYDSSTAILADYYYTWAMTGEDFLSTERGVCCDVANLGAYLLQYDYEELGWIYHHGTQIGHVYNYVYEDGYYYVFDLTSAICAPQQNPNLFEITQVKNLEDYLPNLLEKTDPERIMGAIAVNSLNHTEQPANYMPYMSDDSVCFKQKTCAGFEEGVPTKVLYINPKAEGLFEYVTIPHEDIPDKVPSWFRDVDHDRANWELY